MNPKHVMIVGVIITAIGSAGFFLFSSECLANQNCAEIERSLLEKSFAPITIVGALIIASGIATKAAQGIVTAQGPVNIRKQTIHAVIPGLDTKAAGKINKLKRLSVIGFSIVGGVGFGGYGIVYMLNQFNIVTAAIVTIITAGAYLVTAAYLMRKWSTEWNKQFEVSPN